ncbi:MAG: iron-containing redox enzyme family protein [Burkholderia sp.]
MEMHLEVLEEAKAGLVARIREHSFLARCRSGEVPLEELKLFLVQQGLYSSYFTRYLCALMANLSDNADVLKLAGNLYEELGLADDSETPHSLVYRAMLEHFGLSLQGARPLIGTRRLIDTMFDHCRHPDAARGLAALCLGAEALVPVVYADIIKGFEAHGVSAGALAFFHIHVACDDGHAETMRDILVEIAQRNGDSVPAMLSAGDSLVDARLAFFDSIEAGFARRDGLRPARLETVQ